MRTQIIVLLSLIPLFQGCAGMMMDRSFIEEMEYMPEEIFVPGRDFSVVPGDEGEAYRSYDDIKLRTPLSEREAEQNLESYTLRRELAYKTRRLTARGKMQYREALSYLESDSEKIYFLNLKPDERDDYLRARSIATSDSLSQRGRRIASFDQELIADNGLTLGMSKDRVIQAWGRPERVDVAGDPRFENERWAFDDGVVTRYVYFESGKVQGWQTNR